MASVVQSSPPSLPYILTSATEIEASHSCGPSAPAHIPLPTSPVTRSPPPVYRAISDSSLQNRCLSPRQRAFPLSPISKLPSKVSKPQWSPQPAPARPPRPQKSLPNLRPTIILEPDLISALPKSDRPAAGDRHVEAPAHRLNTSAASSYSSNDQFTTPLPSPALFAPRSWRVPTSASPHARQLPPAVHSPASSKSVSPRCSPTSPRRYYYNIKWEYENIISHESLTALPPPPLPPPVGPLPEPPTHVAGQRKAGKDKHSDHLHGKARYEKTCKGSASRNAAKPPERQPTNAEKIPILPNSIFTAQSRLLDQKCLAELEGSLPITVDVVRPPPDRTWAQRHRRKLRMLATFVLVLVIAAGIFAGILWKLTSLCHVGCEGQSVPQPTLHAAQR